MKQKQSLRAIQVKRYLRYSIRKFTVGVASVAIASGLMVFGADVQAAEEGTAATVQQTNPTAAKPGENVNKEGKVEKTNTENKVDKAITENKVAVKVDELQKNLSAVEARLAQLPETKETKSAIDAAKEVVKKANKVLNDETKTQESVNAVSKELSSQLTILNSMKTEIDKEEKEHKNNDPRNGKAIPGNGESGFRATPTGIGEQAAEGPTSNNKRGVGANPVDNVISSLKNQFGDIDFNTPDVETKSATVENQYSRNNTSSPKPDPVKLGKITYNWKEKRIENEIDGWKIEGTNNYVTAIKPEAPTEVAADRPAGFDPKPSKVYDNNGSIDRQYNDTPVPGNPLAPNKANQNYANGVNYSSVPGVPLNNAAHSAVGKGYYIQLNKKGTQISKEFNVNPNSRLYLSALTGGAYGNMGTAGTGEKVEITVRDADTGEVLRTLTDANNHNETTHVSTPYGDGGNGNGFGFWRTIINTPNTTKKIKVTIKALEDGPAFNKTYPVKGKTEIEDGYFVGGVNLTVGAALEMTTDVTRNKSTSEYGEDVLYKDKESGQLKVTVKNVGGLPTYGAYEYTIKIPEGVELKDSIKKANAWNWPGPYQVVSYDETTRTLRLKFNAGDSDPAKNGTRTFGIDFTTAKNFKGTATFKVTAEIKEGFTDLQGNRVLENTGVVNPNSPYRNTFNALGNTDNPDYYYNKTIYIDTVKPVAPTVEPVHTDSINGEKTDKNQVKELLVSVPTEKQTNLTDETREKQDIAENDRNNGTNRDVNTEVSKIKEAIGGLTSLKVTLPNSKTPITLTKKADGWYNGVTKVEVRDGKLVVPVPAGTDLTEANETTNPDKRIKVTVLDKAGNESDPAYANVLNEAPTVAVEKKDLYVYKTKEADKWNNAKVLEKAKPSATDLEDDRDGVDSTKPTIAVSDAGNLDTTTVGDYTVKVQSTDSEGKKSTETNVTVHVLDLIKVDPTVTTDPTNPSTTSPVSPKTADTPVKPGDENLGKYPAGLTREDLVKEVTRTIKYLKEEDANKADATGLKPEKVQKVTYKRTATVNPETKEVTYSDWEVYNEADKLTDATVDGTKGKFNAVDSPVVDNYLLVNATDKTVAEQEAPVPAQDGTTTPEVKKVLYKEIGSFTPNYPEGKKPNGAQDKIPYPNNPNDPTVPGDFSTVTIPYVPGYTPVYNGQELTPKNPNDPTQGYKVPDGFTPTDKFGESPITYTPSTQTAKVVIEKKVDGGANEVVSSFDLTGKSGSELPASTDVDNKIKELKNQGYEVESDEYHTQDNHHPIFDDKEDVNPTDGSSAPSQTFKIVVKPRIVEIPSSTPHEKDSPVDPNGENPELKWPEGLTESDLNTTAKRVISYVKKDSDTAAEEKAKDDTVQTVPFTRKATVNLVTKEVTYTDWESPNKTWDKVGVDVLPGYIADKKEIPAKEAVTPAKDTKVIPDETDKVTYTKIGSWIPVDPTTGNDGEPIPFPNDPNDPTKTGEITQIIPHKDGYTPKDGNGTPLEPVNPANPEQGYKPPKITDPKTNIKITYEKDDQKAKVKFVSVDSKTQTETELTDHALTLTGKSGETIPESDVQTHIDVLKSMGYDIVDNPFDKDPVFDTKKDTNGNITQEFTIKVQPRVSTAKTVYVVEGDKPSAEKLKDAVTTKGNEKTVDETKIPETTGKVGDDSLTASVTVTYGSGDKKREEIVNVPVKVVKGYPQIVPVDELKKQPSPEDSIDTDDYPDDATFEYKEEVDTSTAGDKKVTVVVKQGDKVLVEVPATVRVVESHPQFVPVDKDKKQPAVEGSIDPKVFPKDTEFTYETPVDTTTPGEKDVVVVAKIGDKVIAKVPAKVMVVEPKTQYVPVDKSNKQPDVSKSIDPEQYPDGVTFKYKTPVDTTTPGEKDVVVEAKDGEDKLVEVPAKVKVVEGKEQLIPVNSAEKPQARDNITPSDYPEGSTFEYKVPDGQTEPFDATTVGDKPVTVVVKDKNGNVLVEVPATIKVVEAKPTPIETPVTNTALTKEDIAKYVKVPEGGKVTNVENIPDVTTPGKKDPVKVTVELPNGKTITVDVPVEVTPVKGIETPVTKTPLTPEDYTKGIKIPEGGKVTNVENIPDLTTPGKKDPVKVTVELPNGKTITVEVPVNVTPATGIETPVTDTPLTKEDIEKHVKVPEGGKIVGVGEIPKVNTPGDKGTVKVKIELPGGKQIEVEVPVKVTPIKDIVKKLGDPITNEDVEKHIQIPEGGKIISIGDKPSTEVPGERPSIPVVIELPGGKRVTVNVPVIVTPKTTPIVVEVGTPITEDMVKKHVDLPEGWKITKVGEIPKTNTPGDKPSVTVELELPDGRKVTVDIPVKVIEKNNQNLTSNPTPSTPTTKVTTHFVDENGKDISTPEEGVKEPKVLEGYEYTETTTDANGNKVHHYKKAAVTPSVNPNNTENNAQHHSTDSNTSNQQTSSNHEGNGSVSTKQELPNTGESDASLFTPAVLAILSGLGIVVPTVRKKKDKE